MSNSQPLACALALIEQLSFRVAKSMPEIPHEYTVRDRTDDAREAAYVGLFDLIQAKGVLESFNGHERRYLYPGDGRKYWAMTDVEPESRVINRMRVEDDIERLRREGQIP
jgi:hypothetical protein